MGSSGLECRRKYNQADLLQRLNNNFRRLKFPKRSSSLLARITPGQPRKLVRRAVSVVQREWQSDKQPALPLPFASKYKVRERDSFQRSEQKDCNQCEIK